jgi:hypothetical protein
MVKIMNTKWYDLFGSEFEYIKKLGNALHDPEQKREFWEMVKAQKLADKNYSIYQDFPVEEKDPKMKAMRDCCEFVRGLRIPKPKDEDSA